MFYISIYNFNNKYISFKDLSDKAWTENTSESIFVKKRKSVAPLHLQQTCKVFKECLMSVYLLFKSPGCLLCVISEKCSVSDGHIAGLVKTSTYEAHTFNYFDSWLCFQTKTNSVQANQLCWHSSPDLNFLENGVLSLGLLKEFILTMSFKKSSCSGSHHILLDWL